MILLKRFAGTISLACLLSFSGTAIAENSIPPWPPSTDRTIAAHVRAEAVQRAGGEWVLLGLSAEPIGTEPRRISEDRVEMPGLLDRYAQAFKSRDVDRLNRVWVLNPNERKMVTHLFKSSESIDLTIKQAAFFAEGDRNWVEFDQYLSRKPRNTTAAASPVAFRRTLEAHDVHGAWAILPAHKAGGSLASATTTP